MPYSLLLIFREVRTIKKWISIGMALLVFATVFFPGHTVYANTAEMTEAEVSSVIKGIINWKKADNGAEADDFLINDTFLQYAGETAGDWFPIGLGRYGAKDNYEGYLAVITDNIEKRYQTKAKLHAVKATEWHRISLAVLAAGGDPTHIGKDPNGQPINLIADGTYNRGKTVSLGRQGINGWIWGLIALDSKRYSIPQNSYYTREDIITEILRQQLGDGGFALSGNTSDPDITAMAIQALAPYYNDSKAYTYEQKKGRKTVTRTVHDVVDDCLQWLSGVQLADGDFSSWGTQNVESTCQVTVALCSLGIDPASDPRFIKNGNTLLDGILKYRMKDGGFIHSFTYDSDNPTALPSQSNSMASEQALYTWVAVYRQRRHMRNLYDFRAEWSQTERKKIDNVIEQIRRLPAKPSQTQIQAAYDAYCSIPAQDRCYVSNYWKLESVRNHAPAESIPPQQGTATSENSSASSGNRDSASASDSNSHANSHANSNSNSNSGSAASAEKPGESTASTPSDNDEDPGVNSQPAAEPDEEAPLLYFSNSDRKEADSLPEKLTTKEYVAVTRLLYKLENSEQFDEKEAYLQKLTSAKSQIEAIQKEIDSINAAILEKLYPFESISLGDKAAVDSIVDRYNALSEYDRTKIDHWEDVVKTKTKIDNLLRGIIIAVVLIVVAGGVAVFVVLHVRKRRRSKELAMEELAKQYADEDDKS